ncbi:MAG: WYL domain-containing protein [Cyanobacteria bacterium J06649_11]
MHKDQSLRRYSKPKALKRLLMLILTLVEHPGIGSPDSAIEESTEHHDALQVLCDRIHELAQSKNIDFSCSANTIRKDLGFLRQSGLLSSRMYRWGYFLGQGLMTRSELRTALNALAAQATHQKDPQVRQLYEKLTKRIKPIDPYGELLYPVRTQLNQSIIYTDSIEMMSDGHYRPTLIHEIEQLEQSILTGEKIQLCHSKSPYSNRPRGYLWVYPLQIIHNNIAWYLLYEHFADQHLAITRLDRFSDHYRKSDSEKRGIAVQQEQLKTAHQLLATGWGLFLGNLKDQKLELQGKLTFIKVIVRFFPPVLRFILEGERRHQSQKIIKGPIKDSAFSYVDYEVSLPPRSVNEFSRWVYGFMGNAQFIEPKILAQEHHNAAKLILDRYNLEA